MDEKLRERRRLDPRNCYGIGGCCLDGRSYGGNTDHELIRTAVRKRLAAMEQSSDTGLPVEEFLVGLSGCRGVVGLSGYQVV